MIQDYASYWIRQRNKDQQVFQVYQEPQRLTVRDAANAIWQTSVVNNHWSATRIAERTLGQAGNEVISKNGRFWKRAKQMLRDAIVELTDLEGEAHPNNWSDNYWDRMFESLRNEFRNVVGTSQQPPYRNYWVTDARTALVLGQWFSLYKKSCHWSCYSESFRQLLAGKGHMVKGMWSARTPTIAREPERRKVFGTWVTVPKLTDYDYDDKPSEDTLVVRAWIQPLSNGLIAMYNGYISEVWSKQYDFTTKTRHYTKRRFDDVCPLLAADLVKYLSEVSGIEMGSRKVSAPDSIAYVNNNHWYLIGDVTNDYIQNHHHMETFETHVHTLSDDWADDDTESGYSYLDQGWHEEYNNETEYGERFSDWVSNQEENH